MSKARTKTTQFDLDKEGRFVIVVPSGFVRFRIVTGDDQAMNYMDYILEAVENFRNNPDIMTLILVEYEDEGEIRIVDLNALQKNPPTPN